LELGEVGLGLFAIWLLSCARQLHRALKHNYEWASLAICLLLMGLLYNISESALNTFTEEMTVVVALASAIVPYKVLRRSDPKKSLSPRADNVTQESAMAVGSW